MAQHIFSRYTMEIHTADPPRVRTYSEGFNDGLKLASAHTEDEIAEIITALDCLYRLAIRGGLCPTGEKRCEMDNAKEKLEKCGRTL